MVGPEARDYKRQYLAALLQFSLTWIKLKILVYILLAKFKFYAQVRWEGAAGGTGLQTKGSPVA